MAHLTCVGQTRGEIHGVLTRLEQAGIENVIALRGDPPRGQTDFVSVKGGFSHATDLIRHISQNFSFDVAAACYPEGHLESPGLERDMKYTKLKLEMGASFLITQLFFDNRYLYSFMDRARKSGHRRADSGGYSAHPEHPADPPVYGPLRLNHPAG